MAAAVMPRGRPGAAGGYPGASREVSLVRSAVIYCDITVSPGGCDAPGSERLAGVGAGVGRTERPASVRASFWQLQW